MRNLFGRQTISVASSDYFTEVSKGNVSGDSGLLIGGFNDTLISGITQDVWCAGGVMQWIETAEIIEVESIDANDTNGGSGAWSLLLIGRLADGTQDSEVIVLNGGVADSSKEWIGVTASFLLGAGASNTNEGEINFTGKVSGFQQNCIPAGRGLTDSSNYRVPSDRAGIITGFRFSGAKTSGGQQPIINFKVQAQFSAPNSAWITIAEEDLNTAVANSTTLKTETNNILEGGAKIRTQVTSDEDNTTARIRLDGILFTP